MISAYVYKITDKESGEFYIGYRHSNVKCNRTPDEDFLIYYFSSGKLKSKLIENIKNFIGVILFKYNDADVCYWYEQLLIRENVNNPKCLNGNYLDPDLDVKKFCRSGSSGWNKGKRLSEEHRRAIGKGNIGRKVSEETREKQRKAKLGKKLSEEHKKSISNSGIGRQCSEETREKIKATQLGRNVPKERIEKISASLRGKPWSAARRRAQELRGASSQV